MDAEAAKLAKERIFDLVKKILNREPHLADDSVADLGYIKLYTERMQKALSDSQK